MEGAAPEGAQDRSPEGPDPEYVAAAGDREAACLRALSAFFARPDVLDWGIAPARSTPNAGRLAAWVGKGYHASMEYMARRLAERMDPGLLHPWARSAVLFSFPYREPLGTSKGPYRMAAYAFGGDYHDRARALLRDAEAALRKAPGLEDVRFYGFADTAPVFERDLASEAGLGWRGKNGCTLNRAHGSAFHLSGFLLDVALPASRPVQDFCGGCTRCIDLCPTGAFQGPGVLDANKCISYWTIEAKGEVPESLGGDFGGWIFGCDVCQEVCPWNLKHLAGRADGGGAVARPERASGRAGGPAPPTDAAGWLALLRQGGGFQSAFRGTPLTRAGRRAMLRNVAIAARNLGDTSAHAPLAEILASETDPALRKEIGRTLEALGRVGPGDRQPPARPVDAG
jgi:epoxyqueuosine reductase